MRCWCCICICWPSVWNCCWPVAGPPGPPRLPRRPRPPPPRPPRRLPRPPPFWFCWPCWPPPVFSPFIKRRQSNGICKFLDRGLAGFLFSLLDDELSSGYREGRASLDPIFAAYPRVLMYKSARAVSAARSTLRLCTEPNESRRRDASRCSLPVGFPRRSERLASPRPVNHAQPYLAARPTSTAVGAPSEKRADTML